MRFRHRQKIADHIDTARTSGKRHIYARPYMVPVFGLLLAAALMGTIFLTRGDSVLRPSDSHVVFVSDGGVRQTLTTKAATVNELINKLPLNLIPEDVVEPSLDTPIVEDNFRINVYRARPVTVIDNGLKTVTITAKKSARVVAQEAGATVYPEDIVSFKTGDLKENIIGEKVVVVPAIPVKLSLYGQEVVVRSQEKTVGALLKEKKVIPAEGDTLLPAANTPVSADMLISLIRNGIQVITAEVAIPAPVQIVTDSSLSFGASAVRQAGVPGKKMITYRVETREGVEVSRVRLQEAVVQEPVPQITARGIIIDVAANKTETMAAAGIASSDYGYANFIISHESGWRTTARNANSGAYGLCQALPGSKMSSAGSDWAGNPVTQLRWCSGYAQSRYGGWSGAYSFWQSKHYW